MAVVMRKKTRRSDTADRYENVKILTLILTTSEAAIIISAGI
jgi:hypothetical protein